MKVLIAMLTLLAGVAMAQEGRLHIVESKNNKANKSGYVVCRTTPQETRGTEHVTPVMECSKAKSLSNQPTESR